MLPKRRHLPTYPNGVVGIYESVAQQSKIGARSNPRKMSDISFVVSLCYSVESMRESDYEFAQQKGVNAEMKLRCPFCRFVKPVHKALVEGRLYDLYRIDPDGNREMYLYLSGGRDLEGDPGEDQGDA